MPQSEGRNYAQAELLGRYTSEDSNYIPEKFEIRPYIGLNYLVSNFATTIDSLGQPIRTVYGTGSEAIGLAQLGSYFTRELDFVAPRLRGLVQFGFEDEFHNNTAVVLKGGSNWLAGGGFEYAINAFSGVRAMYRFRGEITSNRNSNELQLTGFYNF
jgi:hypothetical protein